MSGLGAILNPRLVGWPGAVSQPWSWAAYQEYADGMERYVVSDYLGAATHFGRAFEMDTGLLIAELWHANSNANGISIDGARTTRRKKAPPLSRWNSASYAMRPRGFEPLASSSGGFLSRPNCTDIRRTARVFPRRRRAGEPEAHETRPDSRRRRATSLRLAPLRM